MKVVENGLMNPKQVLAIQAVAATKRMKDINIQQPRISTQLQVNKRKYAGGAALLRVDRKGIDK